MEALNLGPLDYNTRALNHSATLIKILLQVHSEQFSCMFHAHLTTGYHWKDLFLLHNLSISDANFCQRWWLKWKEGQHLQVTASYSWHRHQLWLYCIAQRVIKPVVLNRSYPAILANIQITCSITLWLPLIKQER